jgi:hypothetical protein
VTDWELLLPVLLKEYHTAHCTSQGKVKTEVCFLLNNYRFCTIVKWKNGKTSHHKLVTIVYVPPVWQSFNQLVVIAQRQGIHTWVNKTLKIKFQHL